MRRVHILSALLLLVCSGGTLAGQALRLEELESLDLRHDQADALYIGAQEPLLGEISFGALEVRMPFGATRVEPEEVVFIVNSGIKGGAVWVYLRSGEVLGGTVIVPDITLVTSAGFADLLDVDGSSHKAAVVSHGDDANISDHQPAYIWLGLQ